MSTFATTLLVLSCASIAALIAALAASGLRRWRVAATISGSTALAGLALSVLILIAFKVRIGEVVDPSQRATVLSEGLSEMANRGAAVFLIAVPSALLWVIARWRIRKATTRSAG